MNCRLCLIAHSKDNATAIFSRECEYNWTFLIAKYLYIQISENDGYSTSICQKCSGSLQEFHNFCEYIKHCQHNLPTFPEEILPENTAPFSIESSLIKSECILEDEQMEVINQVPTNAAQNTSKMQTVQNDVHNGESNKTKAELYSNPVSNSENTKFYKTIMLNVAKMIDTSLNEMRASLEVRMDELENKINSPTINNIKESHQHVQIEQDNMLSNVENNFSLSHQSNCDEVMQSYFPDFPLSTAEAMYKFNTDLENVEYFEAAKQYLVKQVKARKASTSMFTRRMQLKNLMFSRRILRQFTWKNPKGGKMYVFSQLQQIIRLFVQVVNAGVTITKNTKHEIDTKPGLTNKKKVKRTLTLLGAKKYFLDCLKRDGTAVKYADSIDIVETPYTNFMHSAEIAETLNNKPTNIFPELPLNTVEAVYEFEQNLKNLQHFQAIVEYLNLRLKERASTNTAYSRRTNLRHILFTDNILRKFTWKIPSGAKEHKFSTLTSILNLFVEVIKTDTNSSSNFENFYESTQDQEHNKKSKRKKNTISLDQISQYFKDMLKREGKIPWNGNSEVLTSSNDPREFLSTTLSEDTATSSNLLEEQIFL